MFTYIFIAIFVLVCVKWYGTKATRTLKDKNGKCIYGVEDIPGDPTFLGNWFIGNLPKFIPYSGALNVGEELLAKHGGLLKVIGANKAFVGFCTPELMQKLFKSTEFGHNVKSPIVYDRMKPFINNGVLVPKGPFWQGQRKILMKTQSYQNLKLYTGMLNEHTRQFIKGLEELYEDGKPHQINEAINVLFLKVICEIITGNRVKSTSELDRYHHNFQMWKHCLLERMLHPWLLYDPLWNLHPMSKKFSKAIKELIDFAKEMISEHQCGQKFAASEDEDGLFQDKRAFRSVLDELVDADANEDQIVDEINTMLFGGHETGASTLHFFCFSMALNPDFQRLCRQEVDETFENSEYFSNGQLTFEAVNMGLKYLERCIQETMRLYPAIFMMFREFETSMTIEHNNRIYLIPAGTTVGVCPYVVHRSPKYFSNPKRFDPDRFLPEEVAKRHPWTFVPFSGGPRSCLGMKFAMLEMKLVAAYLLRHFEMKTTDKFDDIALLPFITLTPERDYTFIMTKRQLQN